MSRWRPGESGNPGGRPKELGDLREIARKHTPEAIETLVSVMHNARATDQARVHAATALLDRGWGRPAQTINATIDANNVDIDARLQDRAAKLLESFVEQPENTRETEAASDLTSEAEATPALDAVAH